MVNFIIARMCPHRGKISYYLPLLVGVNMARLNIMRLNKGTII